MPRSRRHAVAIPAHQDTVKVTPAIGIELTAIDLQMERGIARGDRGPRVVRDLGDEVDRETGVVSLPATVQHPGLYYAVTVYEHDIREYYPRRHGNSGTRIVFSNGAARPVRETYEEVKAKFAEAKAGLTLNLGNTATGVVHAAAPVGGTEDRNSGILRRHNAGESLATIARSVGLSRGRVAQIIRQGR